MGFHMFTPRLTDNKTKKIFILIISKFSRKTAKKKQFLRFIFFQCTQIDWYGISTVFEHTKNHQYVASGIIYKPESCALKTIKKQCQFCIKRNFYVTFPSQFDSCLAFLYRFFVFFLSFRLWNLRKRKKSCRCLTEKIMRILSSGVSNYVKLLKILWCKCRVKEMVLDWLGNAKAKKKTI